ncbi:MAG: Bax inhibitor-1/YccA family protein [Micromonosporaceae bacterium]|nr:Bax inhibitor-1/YccA family protein [Micromonosporaceae bacterium]
MRSSNPVLTRLTPETHTAPAPGYGAGYGSPYPTYQEPTYVAQQDRMTIDDVVVKTVSMLGLVLVSGLATAYLIKDPGTLLMAWIGGAIVGLVLGLVISFKRIVSPPLMVAYAIVEGVFLGAVSKAYNTAFHGIVLQAVIGTFAIFFVMAALYKARVIRATPKFARFILGAVIAAVVVMLARLVASIIWPGNVLSNGSGIAILISLAIIAIGALTFILDFDQVEHAVTQGAPKNMAWMCAFGILVGLIWVYLEVLRLLSYLRSE